MVKGIENWPSVPKLKELELVSLEERRLICNLIMITEYVTGYYEENTEQFSIFTEDWTKENELKLQ